MKPSRDEISGGRYADVIREARKAARAERKAARNAKKAPAVTEEKKEE